MAEEEVSFGELLEILRDRTGLSQDKIAERLGITTKTYRAWLRGQPVKNEIRLIEQIAPLIETTLPHLIRKRFDTPLADGVPSEEAIESDSRLTRQQKDAVIGVIKSYVWAKREGDAGDDKDRDGPNDPARAVAASR